LGDAEVRAPHGEQSLRSLSQRECEVLKLLVDCKSNKEIAGQMNISVRTAETYRARIMIKLELHSIGHLVRYAVRNNIIEA
jgi:DNA-binding NarL/FixJ family response regulator